MTQEHSHRHQHLDGTVHAHEHDHANREHERVPRNRRGEPVGQTRSMRLPASLDRWLEEHLAIDATRSSSDVLVELVHGGLRLREGYMAIHRRTLERLIVRNDAGAYVAYLRCLFDTFGQEYVEHLEAWLHADGIALPPAITADASHI